jgi:hypothetical protein
MEFEVLHHGVLYIYYFLWACSAYLSYFCGVFGLPHPWILAVQGVWATISHRVPRLLGEFDENRQATPRTLALAGVLLGKFLWPLLNPTSGNLRDAMLLG